MLSDKKSRNNGKHWRYILGYQEDGKQSYRSLFIKRIKEFI